MTKKKTALLSIGLVISLNDEERRVLRELRDSYAAEDDATCNDIAEVLDGLLKRTRPDA
jgi:hypothetical protein